MLRIARRGDRHDPRDLNVAVRLEGAYDAAFLEGRQDGVIPGETLKNIVHAGARAHGASEIEELGLALSRQIVERQPRLSRVRVEIAEKRWLRLEAGGKPQAQTFLAGTDEQRLAIVTTNGQQTSVVAGVSGLTVMRTSGFTSGTLATNDPFDIEVNDWTNGLPEIPGLTYQDRPADMVTRPLMAGPRRWRSVAHSSKS